MIILKKGFSKKNSKYKNITVCLNVKLKGDENMKKILKKIALTLSLVLNVILIAPSIKTEAKIHGIYREASVKKVLAAPRFSQTTYDLYLTNSSAIQLANKFSVSSKETIITFFAGFLPHAMFPSLALFIGQCNRNSAAAKIRTHTDKGHNVKFRITHNSYTNTYNYAAFYWDGNTLDYNVVSGEKIKKTILYK